MGVPAELEAGYLFRLSHATRTRIRIWITDKGYKGCPRLKQEVPEASAEIRKHFKGLPGKAAGRRDRKWQRVK